MDPAIAPISAAERPLDTTVVAVGLWLTGVLTRVGVVDGPLEDEECSVDNRDDETGDVGDEKVSVAVATVKTLEFSEIEAIFTLVVLPIQGMHCSLLHSVSKSNSANYGNRSTIVAV